MVIRRGDTLCILGGSGFVGRALILHLHAEGYVLRVMTRHPQRHRDLLVLPRLTLIAGDPTDERTLAAAVEPCQAVINLVGILVESRATPFARVHEQLPAQLGRLAGPRRIIHISALGASPGVPSRYLQSKARGEAGLRAGAPDAIIVRPALIYGAHDHFICRFSALLRWAVCGLPVPAGRVPVRLVAVTDVVAAIGHALTDLALVGGTLSLCGPERLTLAEAINLIATHGPRRHLWVLSPRLSLWAARISGMLPGAPFSVDQLRTLEATVGADCVGLEALGLTGQDLPTTLAALAANGRAAC